jgi:hypothetical protein
MSSTARRVMTTCTAMMVRPPLFGSSMPPLRRMDDE